MCIIQFELQAHAPVHQSWLKITCVSSGEFLGPMKEMGMKFKHLGGADPTANIEKHGFKITINPKLTSKS